MDNPREQLDRLFAFDAGLSLTFGITALMTPHGVIAALAGGMYNHSVHETLRCVSRSFHFLIVARRLFVFGGC